MTENLSFPIGKFTWPESVTVPERNAFIEKIAATPANMRAAIAGLSAQQLDTPYREGGWTVRQVVHHVPDSHMHSYIRFKFALTEEEPAIKPYDEAAWALLSDSKNAPVETSLTLLECLHARWVDLMRGMSDAEWKRTFVHPALGKIALEKNAALYAWHGDHHVAHITSLRSRNGW